MIISHWLKYNIVTINSGVINKFEAKSGANIQDCIKESVSFLKRMGAKNNAEFVFNDRCFSINRTTLPKDIVSEYFQDNESHLQ